MKMSGFIGIICLCVLFNFQQKGIEGRSLNETHVRNLEMMRPPNSRASVTLNLPKNDTLQNSSRKPKFMTHLSFLTGLGIGSLASAAAFSDANITPPNFHNLFTTPPTTTTSTTTRSPFNDVNLNFSAAEFPPPIRFQHHYNPNYDYSAVLSANALFNQTLKSIERILDKLKTIKEDAPESSKQEASTSGYDDVIEVDANDNKAYRFEDNPLTINCSTLRDILRSSVAEEINKLRKAPTRQAEEESGENANQELQEMDEEMNQPESTTQTEANQKNKTTTTTTEMTPTVPQFSGPYYGGNPQNISGVTITSGAYGPPHYPYYPPISQPNEIYNGLPTYGAVPFRPEFVQDTYPVYLDSSGDSYPGVIDPHFDYSRYGRGKNFITKEIPNFDKNGFIPSPYVSALH